MSESIEQHYEQGLNSELIIHSLQKAYPQGPDIYQLAPVDQLHIGGIKASLKLLDSIKPLNPKSILDIGSGLGGLMRLVQSNASLTQAHETERCLNQAEGSVKANSETPNIIGVEISHSFNQLNRQISALTDQSPPTLITADAVHLPFAEAQFDLILFQHSLLNIPDSQNVLTECQRLLKPNGRLLLHEVIQGTDPQKMVYPVPWARNSKHSHLANEQHLKKQLTQAGFTITHFENWSTQALEWRTRQGEKEQNTPTKTPPVSPEMILGPEFKKMGRNILLNLQSDAIQVVEVMAKKQT